MNRGKIAEAVVAHLLPDYGATDALTAIVEPRIRNVRKLFEAGDSTSLWEYTYHYEGKLGDLQGVERSPESEAIRDINFVVSFKYDGGNLTWGDVGYQPSKRLIVLWYNMNVPVTILTAAPHQSDKFKRDLNRFDISIRHEVTHAVRDSQTHHIQKFMERMDNNKGLAREYTEHGHQDFEFEVDAIINSFDALKRKIGQRKYDQLDEAGLEGMLPGLRFPRVMSPARKVWMKRLLREGLLPAVMARAGKIGGLGMDRNMIASELIRIAEELVAIKFDTRKELQEYKTEHHPEPGTRLQLRNKQEMKKRYEERK